MNFLKCHSMYILSTNWLTGTCINFSLFWTGSWRTLSSFSPASLPTPPLSFWIIFDKFILCCLFRKSCYSHPVEVPEPLAKPWHCQEGGLAGHGTTPGPTGASRKKGQNHYPLFRLGPTLHRRSSYNTLLLQFLRNIS